MFKQEGGNKKKQEKGSMQKILSVDICQRVANQMQPFFSRLNFPIHQPSVKLLRMQLRNHIHRRTYTLPHKRSGLTLVLTCSSDVYYTWKHTITLNLSLLTIDNNPIPCIVPTPPLQPYRFPPLTTAPSSSTFIPFLQCGRLKKRKKKKKGVTDIFCIWDLTSILGPCCDFLPLK